MEAKGTGVDPRAKLPSTRKPSSPKQVAGSSLSPYEQVKYAIRDRVIGNTVSLLRVYPEYANEIRDALERALDTLVRKGRQGFPELWEERRDDDHK